MTRRSASDKEYFVQDWFAARLRASYDIKPLGRNSHPDFLITANGVTEGFELKALANVHPGKRDRTQQPCRTTVDFNSTVPCGRFIRGDQTLQCYYLFLLYEEAGDREGLQVDGIALTIAHGNLLNHDLRIAQSHKNTSEGNFGSYGDGLIRTRKMYLFPNPLTHPRLRYRCRLIIPHDVTPRDLSLTRFATLKKRDVSGAEWPFHIYGLNER